MAHKAIPPKGIQRMIPPFFRVQRLPETASTNAAAQQAAQMGEPEGLVIQASRQTSGKGRQGRAWESPEGNLYASILLRPGCGPQEAGLYSFVAALAVADTVSICLEQMKSRPSPLEGEEAKSWACDSKALDFAGGGSSIDPPKTRTHGNKPVVSLKWPNDVLVNDKKISGILLESAPIENNTIEWLAIGIGINVQCHPENALYPTTAITSELGARGLAPAQKPDVQSVLETLLQSLDHWRNILINQGFPPIRDAWLSHAKTGKIKARLPNETIEGEFAGLDPNGHLILRLPDGTERAISAADVFFPNP